MDNPTLGAEVKFERLVAGRPQSSHPLRDDVVIGITDLAAIKPGNSVTIFAPARDGGDLRTIVTSPVMVVTRENNVYTITTKSGSKYRITTTTP